VNGSSDQPLADAEVSIYLTSNFSLIQTVASSDDGRFVFDSVPKGKYMLQGMRRGFLTAAYDEHDGFNTAIATGEGLASENLIFRLMPDAIISGVVLDENSEPVRQANLVLYMQDTREGIAKVSQVASTMTDDTGGYEFPHLHSGTYFLAANATPWYATHPSNIASAQNPAGPPP
jgi:protocatechuate 3,4-dioxygenase beta subunit